MELAVVLQNAQSPDHATRTNAESFLQHAVETQYGPFVLAICGELANDRNSTAIRQLAGIYLKNLITAQDEDALILKQGRWNACPPEIQSQIRQGFLQSLLAPDPTVCHTAAQVIGAFGALDVPNSKWPDLVDNLIAALSSGSTSPVTKKSSLEALGYMCEGMDPDEVDSALVNKILSGIVGMMGEGVPTDIQFAAITAMLNSLPFTSKNFEVETERSAILTAICNLAQVPDPKIKSRAFECLALVAEYYYDVLVPYMQHIFDLTRIGIADPNSDVAVQAIEFWVNIAVSEWNIQEEAEEEPDHAPTNHQFSKAALPLLIPLLLTGLTRKPDDDDDEEESAVVGSSSVCLEYFAKVVKDDIMEHVLPFVYGNIQSTDWKQKEAAIMALHCVIDGPDPVKMTPIVTQGLPVLIQCLQFPHNNVKDATICTLGLICDVQKEALSPEAYPPLIHALNHSVRTDVPKIAHHACMAIFYLAQDTPCLDETGENLLPTNTLSPYAQSLLESLFFSTLRSDWDEENLRSCAYEAIDKVISVCAADQLPMVFGVLGEISNRLQQSCVMAEGNEKLNLQSSLCSVVGECVKKLPFDQFAPATDRIMELLIEVLKTRGAIAHEDAFVTMGYIIESCKEHFSRYFEAVIPLVLNGLRNFEEHQVCIMAIGVIGDLCRNLKLLMMPACDEIVQTLLTLLSSPTIHRSVKPHVISLFSDIAMCLEGHFERYSSMVLAILKQASELKMPANKTEDDIDSINELRTAILEAYTGISLSLRDGGKQDILRPNLPEICVFLGLCSQEDESTDEIIKSTIALIGDLTSTFGSHMLSFVKSTEIQGFLNSNQENDVVHSELEYTMKVIQKISK